MDDYEVGSGELSKPAGVKRRRQTGSFSVEVFPTHAADTDVKFYMPPQDLTLGPDDILAHSDEYTHDKGHLNSGSTSSTTSGCSSIATDNTEPSCADTYQPDTPTSDISPSNTSSTSTVSSPEEERGGGIGAEAIVESLLYPSVDRDIKLAITPPQNIQLGWAPNVSLSPVFQHRLSSISSISSGRSGSFEEAECVAPLQPYSVLVVTHGGLIQQLIRHFMEHLECVIPAGKRYALQTTPNTGVNKFSVSLLSGEASNARIDCLAIHDKDHLLNEEDTPLAHTGET